MSKQLIKLALDFKLNSFAHSQTAKDYAIKKNVSFAYLVSWLCILDNPTYNNALGLLACCALYKVPQYIKLQQDHNVSKIKYNLLSNQICLDINDGKLAHLELYKYKELKFAQVEPDNDAYVKGFYLNNKLKQLCSDRWSNSEHDKRLKDPREEYNTDCLFYLRNRILKDPFKDQFHCNENRHQELLDHLEKIHEKKGKINLEL